MKITLSKQIVLIAAAFLTGACDAYLDKQPSASSDAPITEAAQLLSLYDDTRNTEERAYPDAYATDDHALPPDLYDARPAAFDATYLCFYTLESEVMESTSDNTTWQYEFAKVFTANTMIGSSVSGTEAEINEARCNGYFMRAWCYFRLAVTYCLPYSEASREKLGLPLRLGTLFTENISRATLGRTFEQILSDLAEAERLCTVDRPRADFAWRASKCAIYGLYARVYLYMNDYDNALSYVEKALALAPGLYDFNHLTWGTSRSYPATATLPEQVLDYCETDSWNMTQIYQWPEWIFVRLHYLSSQWYCPSPELVDCYDDKVNDLRYQFFYVEHGNRRLNVPYDYLRYDQLNDGSYCISGLTTAELLLMKAELQARGTSWQNALATLTPLRNARFATGTATALTASSQSEALREVLKERRREMPFAVRLMDIKRFAVSPTPDDDVTLRREFYRVTSAGVDTSSRVQVEAKGDDPRLAIPIPLQDIQNAQGAIEQNPFK